jgi:hypothetical protein
LYLGPKKNERFGKVLFLLFFSSVLDVSRLMDGSVVEFLADLRAPPDLAHFLFGWNEIRYKG